MHCSSSCITKRWMSLSSCGNCHLKMGHTKKSAHLVHANLHLSKHSNKKAERTAIERDTGRLRIKLNKGQKDVDDAKRGY